MIIWINGAFGTGKTQAAYELCRRLENAYVYDPENAGIFLRKNLPPALHAGDFQDYPMWRSFNAEMLAYLAEHHTGDIIVPMTITNRQYYHETIRLLPEGFDIRHFILYAEKETLLKRLASRLEGRGSWAAQQIDRCILAFDTDFGEYKIHTDHMTVSQVTDRIAALAGLSLSPDSRNRLRKIFDRTVVQLRHIR